MMPKQINDVEAVALDWVVRVGDPAFEDWDAFQTWLEADPGHAAHYHMLAAEIDEVAAASVPLPAPVAAAAPRRRSIWIGSALAASLAVVVGYATLRETAAPYAVETTAGAMRMVALADGSTITLGGATRVTLDRHDQRIAVLDHGQALFQVHHDARDPFEVTVGGQRLVDIGTAFDVKRSARRTLIAVSEGAVEFAPDGAAIRLVAGQGLVAQDGVAPVATRVDIAAVGAWRDGNLAYDGAPLSEVAADLTRSLGVTITADRSVATRPFYGTIVVPQVKRDPHQLAALLDLTAQRRGTTWVLTANP
jgi:transmembrane sensor